MATRHTRKKPKFNKTQKQVLAVKLDKLAQNVSKRGAYVVMQSPGGDYYTIVDALHDQRVILTHIFQKSVAKALCVRLNHRNKPSNGYEPVSPHSLKHCQQLLDRYADLYTESVFHKYTIKTTKREFMRNVAFVRLHETILKLKYVSKQLKHQL